MDLLSILGSRNRNGQTAQAAQAFLRGAIAAGAETEELFLTHISLDNCRQCDDNGWGICRSEGRCVIDDDFQTVVQLIRSADAVVFATPVYFSDLSESMKAFLDRVRRITRHENGLSKIEGKPAVGICVAGGGGGGAPQCALNMEKTLRTCGFDVVDTIPVRRQNLEVKCAVLETTGEWLVERNPGTADTP